MIRCHKFTDRTVLVVDGSWSSDHPMIGGAGLVLVDGSPTGEITGQRYCGFRCHGSQDAEYQAILRAHHWAPEALIFSDAKFVVNRLQGYRRTQSTIGRQVRFLRRTPHLRGDVYQRAHRLSVQGRQALVNREDNECSERQDAHE
jgi:ribonuclease HI